MNSFGIITTLTGDHNIKLAEFFDVISILEGTSTQGSVLSCLRSGEKYRLKTGQIILFLHALHKDRTNHSTPTNDTDFHLLVSLSMDLALAFEFHATHHAPRGSSTGWR